MNSDLALKALEDIVIGRNVHDAAQIGAETDTLAAATVVLRERREMIKDLQAKLSSAWHSRNHAAVSNVATAQTLDHVIRDFARSAGVSEDELRKRYNVVRTQYFNREVNVGIAQGWFTHDPRLEMSDEQKKWFVSGLDVEHGF